jgi:hypothetical protein
VYNIYVNEKKNTKKSRKIKKWPFELVLVVWIDSAEPYENSELEESDFAEPQIIYSIGFLVKDTEIYIGIAGAFKPDSDDLMGCNKTFDYQISIPKVSIIKIQKIKY